VKARAAIIKSRYFIDIRRNCRENNCPTHTRGPLRLDAGPPNKGMLMKITKILFWTLVIPSVSLLLTGCYSLGAWAGHGEKIVPYEPTLTVVTPDSPPAPVQPLAPKAEPVSAEPLAAAPKAVVEPPEVLVTAANPLQKNAPATAAPFSAMATESPAPATAEVAPAITQQLEPAKVTDPEPAVVPAPGAPSAPAVPGKPDPAPAADPAVSPEKMIEDAAKLDSNSTRRSVYVAVAKRFDLSPNVQVRLVNDVYDNLVSETAMEEVFLTLIQNPNFAPAAQHAILKRADDFLSDSAIQRITAALTPNK
jgi:hypothetical protein